MMSLHPAPTSGLSGFVHAMAAMWRKPTASRIAASHRLRGADAPAGALPPQSARAFSPPTQALRARSSHQPLRVLRVVEATGAAHDGGRMRISGRMADVCAELDRMVEREAALQN